MTCKARHMDLVTRCGPDCDLLQLPADHGALPFLKDLGPTVVVPLPHLWQCFTGAMFCPGIEIIGKHAPRYKEKYSASFIS